MASYTPCEGTGQVTTDARRVNSAGLGSKFAHMHGKFYGKCSACGKSLNLGRTSAHAPAPAHKAATID
jgi:hypothetical protein